MKILYCIPSLSNSGGMERILTEKANWLAQKGYNISIVTTEQLGQPTFFQLDPSIRLINFDIDFNSHVNSNLINKFFDHYRKLRIYKRKLTELISTDGYDIVFSLGGKEIEFLGNLDINSRKIAEIHFSQKFKEQFINSRSSGILNRIIGKLLTRKFIRSTQKLDKLVVLTKTDEEIWKKTNSNIAQIYNFTDTTSIENRRLPKSKICIAVGRLDEQKGFDMLVSAWKIVAEAHPDWKLEIYGTGKWHSKLQEEIINLGLERHIFLKGQSRNIRNKLLSSEIFLLTSRYEGFPMVLLEAQSTGLPIVAFNCPTGPNEIIDDNKNGFLVSPGDINTLAAKIIYLMENPEIREQFGIESIRSVQRFEKESIMNEWCKIIEGYA